MPFTERVKLLAKRKAAFRCCVCRKPFVEVHHLLPESEGGPSTLENAAPLCASCHDLYGGNPEKRKALVQMRDHWWNLMEERNNKLTDLSETDVPFEISEDPNSQGSLRNSGVAIYHVVFPHEDFETAASTLVRLINSAQQTAPNRRRYLYLDIDGHRNEKGGYDHDMFELQHNFLIGFLGQYLTEIHTPLSSVRNPKWQNNEVLSELHVTSADDLDKEGIYKAIDQGVEKIWLADKEGWLNLPKNKIEQAGPRTPSTNSKRRSPK